jgi:hypothetical protein
MRDRDGLAEALSAWWPPDANEKTSTGYRPAEGAPIVVMSPKLIASFGLAQQIRLVIPSDLDLATCDGGEYRLWEAIDGRSRTAQPGEQIELEVNDFEPGIVVIDTATLPSALPSTLDALGAARKSLWLGKVPGRRL